MNMVPGRTVAPASSFLDYRLRKLYSLPITNPKQDITISPEVIANLIDCVGTNRSGLDLAVRELIQEIIDRAKIFIARFSTIYFLKHEPIHQFTGLEFRDPETGLITDAIPYRLILNGDMVGIFTVKEVPIDDMYDIRLLIAESQMPEYQ